MAMTPADAFIGGQQARQEYDYGQTRNALANLQLQNAPQDIARRNTLADIQVQDAQAGLDQNKAKDGYTRLAQALQSPNPKAFVLQYEPDLVASLQKSAGVDLSQMDDESAKGVLGALAQHLAGAAGVAPAQKFQTTGNLNDPSQGVYQTNPQTNEIKVVRAPRQDSYEHVQLANGNIGAFDRNSSKVVDTGIKAQDKNENTQLIQTIDPDTKEVVWKLVDKNSGKTVNPNVGGVNPGAAAGAGAGGREATMFNRVLMNASQVTKSAENLMKIPADADRGWFGTASPGTSLIGSAKSALANKMTSQGTQRYNVLVSGIQRSLAGIEAAGLAPSGSLTHQMDAVVAQPGDTGITRLSKLAEIRQIMEEGLSTYLSNPRVAPEQKTAIQGMIDRMQKAIPFTQDDVTALEQSQDPKVTINDVVKQRLNTPAPGSQSSAPITATGPGGVKLVLQNGQWVRQ